MVRVIRVCLQLCVPIGKHSSVHAMHALSGQGLRSPQHDPQDHVHNNSVDKRKSYISDCLILE